MTERGAFIKIEGRTPRFSSVFVAILKIATLGLFSILQTHSLRFRLYVETKKCVVKRSTLVLVTNEHGVRQLVNVQTIYFPFSPHKLRRFVRDEKIMFFDAMFTRFFFDYQLNQYVVYAYTSDRSNGTSLRGVLYEKMSQTDVSKRLLHEFLIKNKNFLSTPGVVHPEKIFGNLELIENFILFGRNCTAAHPKTNLQILTALIMSPLFLYTVFGIVLWSFIEYSSYAFLIAALTSYAFVNDYLMESNKNNNLRALARSKKHVLVFRRQQWQKIDSRDLFPGDLIVVSPSPDFVADIRLVSGEVVVDESFLTGETVPIVKSSSSSTNMVFSGTKILQSSGGLTTGLNVVNKDQDRIKCTNIRKKASRGIKEREAMIHSTGTPYRPPDASKILPANIDSLTQFSESVTPKAHYSNTINELTESDLTIQAESRFQSHPLIQKTVSVSDMDGFEKSQFSLSPDYDVDMKRPLGTTSVNSTYLENTKTEHIIPSDKPFKLDSLPETNIEEPLQPSIFLNEGARGLEMESIHGANISLNGSEKFSIDSERCSTIENTSEVAPHCREIPGNLGADDESMRPSYLQVQSQNNSYALSKTLLEHNNSYRSIVSTRHNGPSNSEKTDKHYQTILTPQSINKIQGPSSSQPNTAHTDAIGLVVSTGFQTAKGRLIRNIMLPKPVKFIFYNQSSLTIVLLSLIGIITAAVLAFYFSKYIENCSDAVSYSLDLILCILSPALPATIRIGATLASKRLKKKSIVCYDSNKINLAGNTTMAIFDKTGTLTSEGLEILCLDDIQNEFFQLQDINYRLKEAISTCHSVNIIDTELAGDPLDVKMFLFSKAKIVSGKNRKISIEPNQNHVRRPFSVSETNPNIHLIEELDPGNHITEQTRLSNGTYCPRNQNTSESFEKGGNDHTFQENSGFADGKNQNIYAEPRFENSVKTDFEYLNASGVNYCENRSSRAISNRPHSRGANKDFIFHVQNDKADETNYSLKNTPESPNIEDSDGPLVNHQPPADHESEIVLKKRIDNEEDSLVYVEVPLSIHEENSDNIVEVEKIFDFDNKLRRMSVVVKTNCNRIRTTGQYTETNSSPQHECLNNQKLKPLENSHPVSRNFKHVLEVDRNSVNLYNNTRVIPQRVLYVKGSPESIQSLLKTVPEDYEDVVKDYALDGYRIISIGYRMVDEIDSESRYDYENNLNFLGFVVFSNRLKNETIPSLEELNRAKIKVLMATGDNILTAISVGRQAKMIDKFTPVIFPVLDESAKSVYDAQWLCLSDEELTFDKIKLTLHKGEDRISYNEFYVACEGRVYDYFRKESPEYFQFLLNKGVIFARMNPEQKQMLVEDFNNSGYSTVFCGDGANDCGALTAADVGISLAENEASIASSFTSTRKDISSVITLLTEGRAALVTSMGQFKFILSASVLQYLCLGILSVFLLFLADNQTIFSDFLLIMVLAQSMSSFSPSAVLSEQKPMCTLFNYKNLVNLAVMVASAILSYLVAFLRFQDKNPAQINDFVKVSKIGTVMFVINNSQISMMGLLLTEGLPHRQAKSTNRIFILAAISTILSNILVIASLSTDFFFSKTIRKYLDLVKMSHSDCLFLLAIIVVNASALAVTHFTIAHTHLRRGSKQQISPLSECEED